ncbi:MAG TPA: MBL fold metallo-hydrolase, partial [Planctomycetaceae bacterium]|nr:MBL fold metallo-hydrolase [Planctomycetaceae bacterium]
MKITFCGAAGEVTGSQHLIECGKLRVLLDCGLFQGHRMEAHRKNSQFRCHPQNLDAVILSHAHIDHCGNLPGLYKAGFRGPIYCTEATADVADIMLRDSVRIQAEDARHLQKRKDRGPPIQPLYDEEHVRKVCKLFDPFPYHEWQEVSPELRIRFADAGHILGSAICELEFQEKGEVRRVVFTGDLGRRGTPLLRDPEIVGGCDVLISESTYGNRIHATPDDQRAALLQIFQTALQQEGRVVIPAFSLGRTQNVVYYLNQLFNEGLLPKVPVFVDSPLSNAITKVYRRHVELLDEGVQEVLKTDADPFDFPGLTYITTPQESMALNHRRGPFVVISASGMCESGRVLHHLRHAVSEPRNTILMIGFQAENTLGRRIVDRQPTLRIFDRQYPLLAHVEVLNGFSAHADAHDFAWWYGGLASRTGIGQAFLVHGEPPAMQALATILRDS